MPVSASSLGISLDFSKSALKKFSDGPIINIFSIEYFAALAASE